MCSLVHRAAQWIRLALEGIGADRLDDRAARLRLACADVGGVRLFGVAELQSAIRAQPAPLASPQWRMWRLFSLIYAQRVQRRTAARFGPLTAAREIQNVRFPTPPDTFRLPSRPTAAKLFRRRAVSL